MQRDTVNRFTSLGKAALAGLLILYVLGAAFLSSDRHLHHAVHHDSEQASHQCAISLFERGQTLSADPVCQVVLIVSEPSLVECNEAEGSVASVCFLSNTTRGPPV